MNWKICQKINENVGDIFGHLQLMNYNIKKSEKIEEFKLNKLFCRSNKNSKTKKKLDQQKT